MKIFRPGNKKKTDYVIDFRQKTSKMPMLPIICDFYLFFVVVGEIEKGSHYTRTNTFSFPFAIMLIPISIHESGPDST